MLRAPIRGLRAPVKLLLSSLVLFLLYHFLPVLLPSSSVPAGPYSDSPSAKRVREELAGVANFDLQRERSSWSAAYGKGGKGGNKGEDLVLEQRGGEEGEGWAPRGGPPPRREWRAAPADRNDAAPPPPPQRPKPLPPPPPPPPPAHPQGDTYEQEIAALEARREAQRKKLREWDARVAAAEQREREEEEGERRGVRVPNAGEEERVRMKAGKGAAAGGLKKKKRPVVGRPATDDDELDAVQKGAGAAVGGGKAAGGAFAPVGGARKKGPLIQVGGAGNAAGAPDAGERAEKAQAAQAAVKGAERGPGGKKDQWRGKGWDQRFRKQPAVEERGAGGEEEKADEDESSPPPDSSPSEPAGPPILLDHHLVKRLAEHDFIANLNQPSSSSVVLDPNLEDSFHASSDDDQSERRQEKRYNITVCALVPHEQRFLNEWLLYHRLLGVERFALYDTSHPGAFGAGEIDSLADIAVKGAAGELGPTVEELKAQVGSVDAGREGLDEKGLIREERIEGLERWIEQGTVRLHWMKFGDKKSSGSFFEHMLEHCASTYGPSTDWLAQLDVDEFLSVSSSLYGADAPYFPTPQSDEDPSDSSDSPPASSTTSIPLQYPLHDLLSRPELAEAACVPLPELNFRNFGVRELKKRQGVLDTQTHRDVLRQGKKVLREEGVQQKTLIHTAYSSSPLVSFSGPHSCKVRTSAVGTHNGLTTAIKNSQGVLLQEGGLYEVAKLPIEPLAISHFLQRDLSDCLTKLGSLSDPNDLHSKSRGAVSCERHYIPSPAELSSRSFRNSPENRFLVETPPEGSVVVDTRMRESWAARAAKEVMREWRRRSKKSQEGRTRGGMVGRDTVEKAKRLVEVLTF
ncbi:hypothetical protein JCM11251_003690 [Rhodosporidiobolus azoricus]